MADFTAPTIRAFQVFPDVPPPLAPLLEMANNLWWVWNPDAWELFRRLDRKLWKEVNHNPVKLLGVINQQVLAQMAVDDSYIAYLNRVYESFKAHLAEKGWFAKQHGDKANLLAAYFSAEFGLHKSLPIYSGGLGVLAGACFKGAGEFA